MTTNRLWGGAGAALFLLLPALAAAAAFDPGAETHRLLDSLPAEARARSDAYFEGGYWLLLWNFLYGAVVASILLFSQLSARLRDRLDRVTRRPFFAALLFGAAYTLLSAAMTLPLDLYQGYFRELHYGLMNQTLPAWIKDQAIALAVNMVIIALFVAILYAVIRAAPTRWWGWGAGLATLFLAVLFIIGPVFIEPLFNSYQPMRDGELKQQILAMARSNGVPAADVLEFDASKQSDRISANVAGFLGTTRIALNDNLLNRATAAEVRAVMGHEMGHYVLNHAAKMLVEFALLALLCFAFVGTALPALLARYGAGWGIRGVDDVAGLPLLFFLLSLVLFVATPVKNSIIRSAETEADYFGLNLSREPDAFASAAMKLAQYRKLSPGPIEELLFYDHPSGRNRILRAMTWKAENLPPDPDGARP